jgi:hypothetical protein
MRYFLAIGLPAAVVGRFWGIEHTTLLVLAAAIGVVGMAVFDIGFHGRYVLANRAEAKRRRRAEAQRKPCDVPP